MDLAERFWSKTRRDENGCLIWTASATVPRGDISYGLFMHPTRKTNTVAHRVAWFLTNGEWPPDDMDLDHLCRVTLCVEPTHLEVVTRAVNNQRRRARPDPEFCASGLHPWVPPFRMVRGSPTCLACHHARQREYYHRTKGTK